MPPPSSLSPAAIGAANAGQNTAPASTPDALAASQGLTVAAPATAGMATQYNSVPAPSALPVTGMSGSANPLNITGYTPPASSNINDIIGQYSTPNAEVSADQSNLNSTLGSLKSLTDTLGTKSAVSNQLNDQYGVTGDTKQASDLNQLINSKTIQAAQNKLALVGQGGLSSPFNAKTAEIDRQLSYDTLGLSAALSAVNGNLALAQTQVARALSAQFDPITSQIDYYKTALDQNRADLTAAQGRQAAQVSAQLDAYKTQVANDFTSKQAAYTEMLKYAPLADAATLQKMQSAKNAGEVAAIAAQAGLQEPVAGRYKDVAATLRNLDGSTYQVTKVLDTVTGQYVNNGQSASQLNAAHSSNVANTPGTTGSPTINATSPNYSTALVGSTQLTQASIDQKALSYLTSGTLPPVGRTGIAGLQNAAISNRMGEMAPGGNLAANKAQLASYATSLKTQQSYLDTTQRAFNTANDTLASLQTFMSKNNINPSQFPTFNQFSNYLKAHGLDPGAAGGYNAQIATLRAEYSQVLAKGGVRSVETDQQAAKLIPDGLAPAQLAQVANQIKIDGNNVTTDAQNQITKIQGQINSIIQTSAATAGSSPSSLPQHTQDLLSSNIKIDGTTAYLPRNVWSMIVAAGQSDAVLAEAEADGYNLLIQ